MIVLIILIILCLASYTPRLAALQVEGGNVGPNVGSAATPPSTLFTPSGAAAQLRCGAGIREPVQRYNIKGASPITARSVPSLHAHGPVVPSPIAARRAARL